MLPDEITYYNNMAAVRQACGLPPLPNPSPLAQSLAPSPLAPSPLAPREQQPQPQPQPLRRDAAWLRAARSGAEAQGPTPAASRPPPHARRDGDS